MIAEVHIVNLLLALSIAANGIFGIIIFARNRASASNMAFFALTIAAGLWGAAMFVLRMNSDNPEIAELFARLLFVAAASIPASFLYFAFIFPRRDAVFRWWQKYLLPGIFLALSAFILLPNVLVRAVLFEANTDPHIITSKDAHLIFGIYIALTFAVVYGVLIRRMLQERNSTLRARLFYIFLGTIIPAVVGVVTNFLLPFYDVFRYNWVGPFSVVFSTAIIAYGILRFRIFDIRVLVAEITMFAVWVIALVRIVLSDTWFEALFNTAAFGLLIVIGIFLVRSVYREVMAREQLEKLTEQLQHTNERLRELDRQKSEFLSIATHQLRGPLAAIRGHLSLVLDGSYGDISKKAAEVVQRVFNSGGLMAETINDFLNVSRIEQGSMKYEKERLSCDELVADIVEDLHSTAKNKKLSLTFTDKCDGTCYVYADAGKLRHIFFNLIDNAIKYTPNGTVKVTIIAKSEEHTVRIEVTDSGVGIDQNEITTLFEKFVRTRDASGINVDGTGLGLYVAREMVEAHNGKIWAESEGKEKGSTFIVELPMVK